MTARIILAALLITASILGLIYGPTLIRRMDATGPSSTQDDEPDDREASGADEEFPEELRAMRLAPVDENLRTAAEQMDADHEDLAEIGRALDHFGTVMTDALSRFLRNQPQTLLRLPSSIEHTGELPIVEMVGV
jgi:hypothetical protein